MADRDNKLHRAEAQKKRTGILHRAKSSDGSKEKLHRAKASKKTSEQLHKAKASEKKNEQPAAKTLDNNTAASKKTGPYPAARPVVRNREFTVIAAAFLAVFLSMAVYLCYFMMSDSEEFISSSYNPRLSALSDSVIKGDITTSDGVVAAETQTDSEGNETRYYPYSNVYAHAIGYAVNGMAGLEKDEDFTLLRSHENIFTKAAKSLSGEKYQGDTVVSTLNSTLQQAAYEGLGNQQGAVIAMDPDTGAVLAMVSKPDYDPNTISEYWDTYNSDSETAVLLNRSTQGLYTPGSTFKIVTVLEYLRENGGSADSYTYTCTGSVTYNGTTVHCANNAVHGEQTLEEAFANSCNCAFASIGLSLDKEEYRALAEELYFNNTLPTQLSNVTTSRFTLDTDSSDELAEQTAFGQGNTMVSPIHMAMIVSAVASGGTTKQPTLVDHVENANGTTVYQLLQENTSVSMMTEEEASVLQQYMRSVVTQGTATSLNSDAYTAYGKTGTAEYNSNKDTNAWFVGYAELDGKKIAVAIVVEDAASGGTNAVPIAKKIFDAYF